MAADTPTEAADGQARDGWATAITDTGAEGAGLNYRGVPLADLVSRLRFGRVWGLLVADDLGVDLPPAEEFPLPVRTGDPRVDLQVALAQIAPVWGFRPLDDIGEAEAREQLARASAMTLSFVAQSARGPDLPRVPQRDVERFAHVTERFLIRWRGEVDPRHVRILDAYFVAAAESGLNPSTVTARTIAATGADVAACLSGAVGALSGPRHGGATARALRLIECSERAGDPDRYVRGRLDVGRDLPGFGKRPPWRADPRATVIRQVCAGLRAPRFEAALALETAAHAALAERRSDLDAMTLFEFWGGVLLDAAQLPAALFTAAFTCARTAGWSAHILEQSRLGGPPSLTPIRYAGRPPRRLQDVAGWAPGGHAG